MKILLINPPLITNLNVSLSYGEPLGLAYVAAAVEASEHHEVEVLDAMGGAASFSTKGDCTLYGLTSEEILLIGDISEAVPLNEKGGNEAD